MKTAISDLIKTLEQKTSVRLIYDIAKNELIGLFYEWRKENPEKSLMYSGLGTFYIGDSIVISPRDKKTIEKLGLLELHAKMIQNSKDQYKAKYERLSPIANQKLDEMESILNSGIQKTGVQISYKMEGDTYGIEEDYQYLYIELEGIFFERKIK